MKHLIDLLYLHTLMPFYLFLNTDYCVLKAKQFFINVT